MTPPNFIVAGVQKARTTAFWIMFSQPLEVLFTLIEESCYWIVIASFYQQKFKFITKNSEKIPSINNFE